ncbi:MAG: cytochrome c family protein [Paracoccaceae bacterium]
MKILLSAALGVSLISGGALAQSAQEGQQIFRRCAGCHQVGASAQNRLGPVLTGVVGRPAGSYPGYRYSKSMIAAGAAGLIWTEDNIFEYLTNPTAFLKKFLDDPRAKAKMSFRMKDEDDRRKVIDFLATFKAATADVPADSFCIVNASDEEYTFTTETREGDWQAANLAPGARLCASATSASDGIVSVFELTDEFEGCSRIIPVGISEQMLEFALAGRCGWSSNKS